MTRPGGGEKPAGAWTADQVVDFLIERMSAGDFYILCPDNDVTRERRREAHPVGGGRHRREPAAAVALASRLQGRLRGVRQGLIVLTAHFSIGSVSSKVAPSPGRERAASVQP